MDRRLLNIQKDDVILAITSAGDNIMDMLLDGPRRIHAVDLNPSQGHLLELKTAAYSSLSYTDTWKILANGQHESFRDLLIHKLSPHMSSQATQFWLNHAHVFTSRGPGLYETGGSGFAIRVVRRICRLTGLTTKVRTMCSVETLNEQRELWLPVRRILMSRPLHWCLISTPWWAWKAAGVPATQRQMIVDDFHAQQSQQSPSRKRQTPAQKSTQAGEAIWHYLSATFDPVIRSTLLSRENYFYHLCLMGRYSRKCHPRYLGVKSFAKLSRPGAFDGLRIHTDEIMEVIARITPGGLSVAVLMDSMDWFEPEYDEGDRGHVDELTHIDGEKRQEVDQPSPSEQSQRASPGKAREQVRALNKVLRMGGRVLLRSAGITPWYMSIFESEGFRCENVGCRVDGKCVDRYVLSLLQILYTFGGTPLSVIELTQRSVNMYASTWLCVKYAELDSSSLSPRLDTSAPVKQGRVTRSRSGRQSRLERLDLGDAAVVE